MQIRPYIVEYYRYNSGTGPLPKQVHKVFAYNAADAITQATVELKFTHAAYIIVVVKVSPDFTAAADNPDSTAQR